MKRFIAVLTFSLLFFAGNADTIGPYEVTLRQKVLASLVLNYPAKVTLHIDSISDADTLYISRANCPGSEGKVQYVCVIFDSSRIHKQDEFHALHNEMIPYKIPLSAIITQYKLTGRKDFIAELYTDRKQPDKLMGSIRIHIQ